jgi:hypothetical protein
MISGPFFFACDPRATRGSGSLCCGCGLARTLDIGHFPGQSRLFSLFGLRVRAAPNLAKSTTYARRFIVNQGHQSVDLARVITLAGG